MESTITTYLSTTILTIKCLTIDLHMFAIAHVETVLSNQKVVMMATLSIQTVAQPPVCLKELKLAILTR